MTARATKAMSEATMSRIFRLLVGRLRSYEPKRGRFNMREHMF